MNFSYYTVKVILSVPWTQQSFNNCDNSYFAELMLYLQFSANWFALNTSSTKGDKHLFHK